MNDKGKYGEQVAGDFLISKGYEIIQFNYHSRYGEIDIIVTDNKYIVFVEVKARSSSSIDVPSAFVTPSKQSKIIKTAIDYMTKYNKNLQPRFDVIEVFISSKKIRHIKNAFIMEVGYASF